MKKLLFILVFFISLKSFGQVPADSARYIRYPYIFGIRYPRAIFDKVLTPPQDTTYSKYGIAVKGGVMYTGNGTLWTPISGSGGTYTAGNGLTLSGSTFKADTSIVSTKNNVLYYYDLLNASKLNKADTSTISNRIDLKADKSTTLTINGTTQDLSANRTWTIAGGGIGSITDNIVNTDNSSLSGGTGSCLRLRSAITAAGVGGAIYVASDINMHDSTATLLAGQTLFGNGATIHSTSVGTMAYAGMKVLIQTSARCVIKGVKFRGAGYTTFRPDWYYTPQNAIQFTDSASLVTNCEFYGFSGAGILGMYYTGSFKNLDNNKVIGNYFKKNAVGINNFQGGNYQIAMGNTFDSNYINIIQNTANAKVIGNNFNYSHIAFYGDGGVADRGMANDNSFNHNDTSIILKNTSYGYELNNNTFFYGVIYLKDCDKVGFNGGLMAPNAAITVDGSGVTDKVVTFSNMSESLANTWNEVGTGKIIKVGIRTDNSELYKFDTKLNANKTKIPILADTKWKLAIDTVTGNIVRDSTGSASTNIGNSDLSLTGDRTLNGAGYQLAMTGFSLFDINTVSSPTVSSVNMTGVHSQIAAIRGGLDSYVRSYADSVELSPSSGNLFIKNLTHYSVNGTNKMLVWDSSSNKVRTMAIPSGGGGGGSSRMAISTHSVGTDANITAAAGYIYALPDATLSTNRTIDVTAINTNGDYFEIDNLETGFTWSFTGATVYLIDGTTTVTNLSVGFYQFRRINGKIKQIN